MNSCDKDSWKLLEVCWRKNSEPVIDRWFWGRKLYSHPLSIFALQPYYHDSYNICPTSII